MPSIVHIVKCPADGSPAVSETRDFIRMRSLGRPRALPPHLAALHDRLRSTKSSNARLPFNDPRVDGCLGGGLPLGQLHEIGAAGLEAEAAALSTAFIASLLAHIAPTKPIFWIAITADLHPPGLLLYGLDPSRLVLVCPAKDSSTLAAMEVVLREGVAGAVVGEVGQFDRTTSRRLQLACQCHGSTGFVLRRWPHGHKTLDRETSVAVTRWHLTPIPSVRDGKEPGLPRWHAALTHARGGRTGEWIMEASDDETHPLRVVAALADHAFEPRHFHLAG